MRSVFQRKGSKIFASSNKSQARLCAACTTPFIPVSTLYAHFYLVTKEIPVNCNKSYTKLKTGRRTRRNAVGCLKKPFTKKSHQQKRYVKKEHYNGVDNNFENIFKANRETVTPCHRSKQASSSWPGSSLPYCCLERPPAARFAPCHILRLASRYCFWRVRLYS